MITDISRITAFILFSPGVKIECVECKGKKDTNTGV
jgi:hypothetical protein